MIKWGQNLGFPIELRILNSLLCISLEDIPLKEQLERSLDIIFSVPFLSPVPQGGIFLVGNTPDILVLKAHRNFPISLQNTCAQVPFGRCLCGRAAKTRQIEFAGKVDHHHENLYEGMIPHGHYNVPIISKNKVQGVLVLYLREGHHQVKQEVEFLQVVANTLAGIIERKQAEMTLREHTKELMALAESSNIIASIPLKENFYEAVCKIAIKQVIFNLLSNALKFTPAGGKIFLKARKFYTNFEEYYAKKYEGTGLGLTLCKKIVELHGGTMRVESELGKRKS
jgi:putative methionine-R-sulfoxide reductase with GAF domain